MNRFLLLSCCLFAAPLAASAEEPLISNARQLVFEGRRSGEGYFSADGRTLVFQSEREPGNPFFQIYQLDLTTGDSRRISPGTGKTTCSWVGPTTGDVLFASTHLDPEAEAKQRAEIEFRESGRERRYSWDYDASMDLFVSDAGTGELTRLTDAPGYDAEASYSPDGKLIAFTSVRSAYPLDNLSAEQRRLYGADPAYFGEIYLMNADGSDVRRLTDTPGYDGGPFFTPDGQRIVWRRFDEKGTTADVYTMKLDGGDVRRLTDFGSMSWAPFFHPSGEYAIFASNKFGYGNFELFLVDAMGEREPVRVTDTDGFDGLASFGPDGTQLTWTSGRTSDGTSQIFLADWDHDAALAMLAEAPKREQSDATATAEPRLKETAAYLASDDMAGRMTGSDQTREAAEHLAEELRSLGYVPAPGAESMLLPFDFASGVAVDADATRIEVKAGDSNTALALDSDVRPLAFSGSGEFEGEVVFAGYGLAPADGSSDSYANLDVEGKVVLVLTGVPEKATPEERQALGRYSGMRYKAIAARDRGAAAIVFVTGPTSAGAGELASLSLDRGGAAGLPVLSVSGDVAATWLRAAGQELAVQQARLDAGDPAAGGVALPVAVSGTVELDQERDECQNVVAVLPPAGIDPAEAEYVVVGAHYDHLGHGETGSLDTDHDHEIHNGADDNASGVAVVLDIARQFAADREGARRGLIVGLWSGEELGLLGSAAFAEGPPLPREQMVAYLNFDMVGRLRDNKLILQGADSSDAWRRIIERRNVLAGFALSVQGDPYLPTDSTSFYTRGVPTLSFFTGLHDAYHRPEDDTETLDFDAMQRIADFGTTLVRDLAAAEAAPTYAKLEPASNMGGRERLRVYLGTIPDYAQEAEGVTLSGARPGSPAEQAGIEPGDVVVEFAGRPIKNLYDYTYAIEAAKVGEPLDVVVLRNGERITLELTPGTRP